ncbi:DUF3152 domain-containing protein [Candidatus Saccharibacteria bacterium]|nr:DUF3152 domain-containing protein [Candidatus Saccharibacteria bacterium]
MRDFKVILRFLRNFTGVIVVIFTTILGLNKFFVQNAGAEEVTENQSVQEAEADTNREGADSEFFENYPLARDIEKDKIEIFLPERYAKWPEEVLSSSGEAGLNPNGTNTLSTETASGHMVNGEKVIYYKTMVWGTVVADYEDFRVKVKETLSDPRGWTRAGLRFVEVQSGQDVNIILSDAEHLDATGGCSGDLSCTTFNNEVIINDLRWREGTDASRGAGMGTRDYQHMVVNHEMGHWLGHYNHVEKCENGGPAPVMLQQSTGLRGCDSFNAWPLESELWTLR